jgi:hypothetical protein
MSAPCATSEAPADERLAYGEAVVRQPGRPRLRPVRLLLSWVVSAASIAAAAWLLPGVSLGTSRQRSRWRRPSRR